MASASLELNIPKTTVQITLKNKRPSFKSYNLKLTQALSDGDKVLC